MRNNMKLGLLVVAVAMSAGCVSPVDIEAELAAQSNSDAWSRSGEHDPPERWWEAFGDAGLNSLIEEALAENLDVKTAIARLDQARALAGVSSSALYPTLDASYAYSERDPANPVLPVSSLSLSASYELDLWGKNRNAANGSRESFAASVEDMKAAATAVAANVATNWYELLALDESLRVLAEQLEVNARYLDLVTLRFQQGRVSHADVLQQRQQVVMTETSISATRTNREVSQHAVAVLLGRQPKDMPELERVSLPELPPSPNTGIPANVLRKRPDVMSAEHRVRSANHSLGQAIAARFPRLSLNVSGSYQGADVKGTFDNWVTSLAANLLGPLFDAGRRKQEVERSRAFVEERLASYRKTVLNALKDVEDALAREAGQADHLTKLNAQLSLARDLLERQQTRYLNGGADYFAVVTALRSVQSLELSLINANKNALLYRIGLYRALGGGWEEEAIVTPKEAQHAEHR